MNEQEWIDILDEDIARIPRNQEMKLKVLKKQNVSPKQMEIFIKEMKEQEAAIKTLRIFVFINYYHNALRKI